jgi:hypothetical protein
MKLEFSGQSFGKYEDMEFHENLSRGSGVVPCGRTDRNRHYEANSRFLQFCERALTLHGVVPFVTQGI